MSAYTHLPNAGVESMFSQILGLVQQSHKEINQLRQECNELRLSNVALEKMLKDSMQNSNGSGNYTPGFATPAQPASPHLRAKSPFLSPPSTLLAHPHSAVFVPSPLGDRALSAYPFFSTEIDNFHVVIPAGGAGTRLWPLSRENHPKFLLDVNLTGRSLIQSTFDRLQPLSSAARLTVVTGPSHARAIKEQLPGLLERNLFIEPGPKDSMAAIGLAAAIIFRRHPDAIIGSFAADHMISGDDAFMSAVAEAVEVAKQDYLVTIGIAPSHPSTGFGYIRLGDRLDVRAAPNARLVSSFKEKPDARTAAAYIATGNYRWNGGMYVTKAKYLLDLLKEYKPEIRAGLMKIASRWDDEGLRDEVLAEVWPALEKIPIDNAVAEPAAAEGKVAVVPATFGWDDVGNFSSLADMLPAELNQPRVLGDSSLVITEQMAGGIIVPVSGRLIACLGVDDCIIVDMPDALMVTTRARSEEVKRLVKKCRDAGRKDVL